jgi:hypothetical protein
MHDKAPKYITDDMHDKALFTTELPLSGQMVFPLVPVLDC